MYLYLQKQEIRIKGFLVSDISKNPATLFGHAVITVDMLPEQTQQVLVPVIAADRTYKEIFEHLVSHRICNVYFLVKEQLEFIKRDLALQRIKEIFDKDIYHIGENIPVEAEHHILIMEGKAGDKYHWRFRNAMIDEQAINSISAVFPDKSALEEFEEQYGRYHVFPAKKTINVFQQNSYSVYMVCSHVDKIEMKNEVPSWIIQIQVGAVFTDRNLCEIKDNTGENISERNRIYSEGTAFYWMWKNAPRTDYIGLCHYRRHFNLEENEIEELTADGLDVLVTSPTFVNETIGAFFSTLTPESDMKTMQEAIGRLYPEYISAAEKFMASRFFPPCNLFIMKYDIFLEYAEFVFSITFEVEQFYNRLGFCRRDRYMGYTIECLLGIFLMKNKERLKIGYTDMKFYS